MKSRSCWNIRIIDVMRKSHIAFDNINIYFLYSQDKFPVVINFVEWEKAEFTKISQNVILVSEIFPHTEKCRWNNLSKTITFKMSGAFPLLKAIPDSNVGSNIQCGLLEYCSHDFITIGVFLFISMSKPSKFVPPLKPQMPLFYIKWKLTAR